MGRIPDQRRELRERHRENERARTRKAAARQIRVQLGKAMRAESGALVSSVCAGIVSFSAIFLYITHAIKDWMDPVILFSSCAAMVAVPTIICFIIGYAHLPQLLTAERFERLVRQSQTGESFTSGDSSDRDPDAPGFLGPRLARFFDWLRRLVTTLALAVVYGYTIFLLTFVILFVVNDFIGFDPQHRYLMAAVTFMGLMTGYFAYVTGATLTAKQLSLLLPLFVVAGVGVAGVTTPYPHWRTNNFSELGDNTTTAARLFNTTLIIAGICVIIISYFAVYEVIASRQQYLRWSEEIETLPPDSPARLVLAERVRHDRIMHVKHFRGRTVTMLVLLILSGILLSGVGIFRYSEHVILHNICGRGMAVPIGLLMIGMPWFAPEFSVSFFAAGYLMAVACSASFVLWAKGLITLVNVEGLLWILYLLWFIVFSRQAAALAQDRQNDQLLYDGLGIHVQQVESPLEEHTAMQTPKGRQRASLRAAANSGTSWSSLNDWSDVDAPARR